MYSAPATQYGWRSWLVLRQPLSSAGYCSVSSTDRFSVAGRWCHSSLASACSSPWKRCSVSSSAHIRTTLRRRSGCPQCVLVARSSPCLLYTSDAADDLLCVDLGG